MKTHVVCCLVNTNILFVIGGANKQGRFYTGAGGTAPPMLSSPPPIFWFQQQKYALLKSRLFLYSGEINTCNLLVHKQ